MRITDLILYKENHKDLTESFDIWISADGKIYDLGVDSSHLSFIIENHFKDCDDLISKGWLKISNLRNKIKIKSTSNAMKIHKKIWCTMIENKLNITSNLELEILTEDIKQTLFLPEDKIKLINLL